MKALADWLLVGWAALALSSLVSMMAVFMGSASGDLHGLLRVQAALLPVTVLAVALYVRLAGHARRGPGLAALWRHTPGWLRFTVASAASLTLIAELTFVLIDRLTETARPWLEHVPAVLAVAAALALAAGFAYRDLRRERAAASEAGDPGEG